MTEAAEFAQSDPEPDASELWTDVYVTGLRRARDRHGPQILMPALSPTMEEGKVAKWLKKVGDKVKSGDVIAEIETDKATMEVEAVDEGKLAEILVAEGTENVKVNTPIAVIAGEGEARPDADAEAAFTWPDQTSRCSGQGDRCAASAPVAAAAGTSRSRHPRRNRNGRR